LRADSSPAPEDTKANRSAQARGRENRDDEDCNRALYAAKANILIDLWPVETNQSIRTSRNAKPNISKKATRSEGFSKDEAERRAWATVNKSSGGGKKSGSGRGKKENKAPQGKADEKAAKLLAARKRASLYMVTAKQKAAARKNIKKAAAAAKKKKTISHLPKRTRTALGKEGAKAAAKKRRN
jgi:hypothetical protein